MQLRWTITYFLTVTVQIKHMANFRGDTVTFTREWKTDVNVCLGVLEIVWPDPNSHVSQSFHEKNHWCCLS